MIPLYHPQQIRSGESYCAQHLGISLYQLMHQAGEAIAQSVMAHYPKTAQICVVCGGGKNGGDGYISAHQLASAGWSVTLVALIDPGKLSGDAAQAAQWWQTQGSCRPPHQLADCLKHADVVVDAILGIGASGTIRAEIAQVIQSLNDSQRPIISIDVPSGLDAATGQCLGATIRACETLTFIGIKQGLVTGQARAYVGKLTLADLSCGTLLAQCEPAHCYLIDESLIKTLRQPRQATEHKGHHGKLGCFGGNQGMAGAIRLACSAALRTGAGLVRVLTHPESRLSVQLACPEAMVDEQPHHEQDSDNSVTLAHLNWASSIVLGPGLGLNLWARKIFSQLRHTNKPMVIDADALHLLALETEKPRLGHCILTPHPGEAARLLQTSAAQIEFNRYDAVEALQKRYGGVIVLKGAGTLIYDGQTTYVCACGNPGMATGGMGDVLSGILGALLAQGYSRHDAALLGVLLHSHAADRNAHKYGPIGLLAHDVIDELRETLNDAGTENSSPSSIQQSSSTEPPKC